MKKLFAMMLSIAMMVTVLAGCGGKTATPDAPAEPSTQDQPADVQEPAAPENDLGGYPDHNISWVVCMNAGAGTDLAVRKLVDIVDLGANVSVENIAGGSQTVGCIDALSRDPDGYTIISMANSGLITQPIMNPDLGYTLDDFKMIAMLTPECTATICVSNSSPIQTWEDWVAFVQSKEDFTYAISGAGGYGQLGLINVLQQLDAPQGTLVGYDGGAGAYQALINGETDFAILDDNAVYSHFNEGECKVLGTIYSSRSYYLPDVPALSEYGLEDLDVLGGWKFIAVDADTPDAVVDYLSERIIAALETDEYNQAMQEMGFGEFNEVLAGDDLTKLMEDTVVLYTQLLKDAGLM
ncbi:tripartite tricarboxylate transporter substrate binding protein [uncultured Dysosmobacter sp.]|uniref:Bug family tripartite tricarboxylate transporter substrate binding protein n=1 Tax=uncultured Dysosmobacter sp. TaxID=2591384 RepID=UPI00262187E5|nr:tripartite tricarboxylate transporter substrate binding protein [uncultured Dysosmobacter sp.]